MFGNVFSFIRDEDLYFFMIKRVEFEMDENKLGIINEMNASNGLPH